MVAAYIKSLIKCKRFVFNQLILERANLLYFSETLIQGMLVEYNGWSNNGDDRILVTEAPAATRSCCSRSFCFGEWFNRLYMRSFCNRFLGPGKRCDRIGKILPHELRNLLDVRLELRDEVFWPRKKEATD